MKTYLLYREQEGGCDYTIGCGLSVSTIRANSMEEAIAKVVGTKDWKKEALEDESYEDFLDELVHDTYLLNANENRDNDRACCEMTLYEVSEKKNMLPLLRKKLADIKEFRESLDQKAQSEHELKEFERLKKKLKK